MKIIFRGLLLLCGVWALIYAMKSGEEISSMMSMGLSFVGGAFLSAFNIMLESR